MRSRTLPECSPISAVAVQIASKLWWGHWETNLISLIQKVIWTSETLTSFNSLIHQLESDQQDCNLTNFWIFLFVVLYQILVKILVG